MNFLPGVTDFVANIHNLFEQLNIMCTRRILWDDNICLTKEDIYIASIPLIDFNTVVV